jgi:hypothetical protein
MTGYKKPSGLIAQLGGRGWEMPGYSLFSDYSMCDLTGNNRVNLHLFTEDANADMNGPCDCEARQPGGSVPL